MLKIYYFLLKSKIHILKYFRYTFDLFQMVCRKKFFWIRDEWNTNKWLKTFIPYQQENYKEQFLKKLDKKGSELAAVLFDKIDKIMYNNILPYKDLFTAHEIKEQELFSKFCLKNEDKIPFSLKEIWSYLNYFYIKSFIKEFAINDIWWKDVIDCWWYNGDSSLAMNTYAKNLWNIYCIEPELDNYFKIKTMVETLQQKNIVPVNVWLSDTTYQAKISFWGAGSSISVDGHQWHTITIDTLDHLVDTYAITPWFIKRDIEWFEYASILWAEKTIKKYKPLLAISIYHTWKDRFEILPLIDSWNLGYKFTLRRWNCFHPFADTLLICY